MTVAPETHSLFWLQCPACKSEQILLQAGLGQTGEHFVRTHCTACHEQGFFQIEEVPIAENQVLIPEVLEVVQREWGEWYALKQRYLRPSGVRRPVSPWQTRGLLLLLATLTLFFLTQQLYQVWGVGEDLVQRQHVIEDYRAQLASTQCLSSSMEAKLRTVPIHYVKERPFHRNFIQYGEAGVYWGEEAIKVFRSNFWFWGAPRSSVLIETLVHEVRHRVSPGLGHNVLFQELVARDTHCALSRW